MALVNQIKGPDPGLFSSLRQIFPNHKDEVLRRVIIEEQVQRSDGDSLLPRCIDVLVNISPGSDWKNVTNTSAPKDKLVPVQECVMKQLRNMFPHVTNKLIQTSVRHPSNTHEPLSVPTLLQRCIDDLLEERTCLDAIFYSDDEDQDDDDDDVNDKNKSKRMTSSANDFKTTKTSFKVEPVDANADGMATWRCQKVKQDRDLRKPEVGGAAASNCAKETESTEGNNSTSARACINNQSKYATSSVARIQSTDTSTNNFVENDASHKVSDTDKVKHDRFSSIEFSDSDSEDSKTANIKDDSTDSDEVLPVISFKSKDTKYFKTPKISHSVSGKQYVSPAKFSAPSSAVSTSSPVIKSIIPSSTLNVKSIVTTILSKVESSWTHTLSHRSAERQTGATDVSVLKRKYFTEIPSTSEQQSSVLPKMPDLSTAGFCNTTTTLPTLSSVTPSWSTVPALQPSVSSMTAFQPTASHASTFRPTGPAIISSGPSLLSLTSRPTVPTINKSKFTLSTINTSQPEVSTTSTSRPTVSSSMASNPVSSVSTSGPTISSLTLPQATVSSLTFPLSTVSSVTSHQPTVSSFTFPQPTVPSVTIAQPTISSITTTLPTVSSTNTSQEDDVASIFTPQQLPELGKATVTRTTKSTDPHLSTEEEPISTTKWKFSKPEYVHADGEPVGSDNRITLDINDKANTNATSTFPYSFAESLSPTTGTSANFFPSFEQKSSTFQADIQQNSHRSRPSTSTGFVDDWNDHIDKSFQKFKNRLSEDLNAQFNLDWPSTTGFGSFRTGSRQDPIVIKEVPQSCVQGASSHESQGPQVTLQNTIPLNPPDKDNTMVTIESLHRIIYQGNKSNNPARPAEKASAAEVVSQTENGIKANPGMGHREVDQASTSVIELTDESSNDSVVLNGNIAYDGTFQMQQGGTAFDETWMDVEALDDDPASLPGYLPPLPARPHMLPTFVQNIANHPPDAPNIRYKKNQDKKKSKRHKRHRLSNPSEPPWLMNPNIGQTVDVDNLNIGGVVDVDNLYMGRAVDVDNPNNPWNMKDDIKNDVLAMFPDVDPAHVDTLCDMYYGPMALNNICNVLLENSYPKKASDKTKAPEATSSTPAVNTETLAAVGVDYFKDYNSVVIPADSWPLYYSQTSTQLRNDFCWLSMRDIQKVMAKFDNYYAPSYQELSLIWKQVNEAMKNRENQKYNGQAFEAEVDAGTGKETMSIKLLKTRRQSISFKFMPEMLNEVNFVKAKLAELAKEADFEVAKQLNEQEYADEGQCIECGCCYGEFPFEGMVQCYEGHLFCRNCLGQYAKEAVYGHGKADMKCMTDMCDSRFPKSQLEKALPAEVLAKYEDRVQEENINLADLGDLVRCPHCDFAALMDPGDKVFACIKCEKATCRHCKAGWEEHFGKRCEEIEKKDETKLRLAYEERMTLAKVRTCHRCKAQFTKEDGCNKMTCRCGAKMCYICRKPDIGYNHFCQHPRDPGKSCTKCKDCSLWTNPEEDDNRAVREIQKEAAQTRKQQGFTEEKLIGAPDQPPAKKARK